MHRRRHHTVYPVLAAAILSIAGCHATGPLQRSVQVSNRPTDDLAEVDAPPQRLATSQPRGVDPAVFPAEADGRDRRPPPSQPEPTTELASSTTSTEPARDASPVRVSDASPARESDASREPVADGRVTDERIAASLATLGVTSPPPREPERSAARRSLPERDVSDVASRPDLTSAMLPAVEQKELIDAFSSSPPEVQELALRQLIAMASRSAERTSQPGNIEDALARAVAGGRTAGPESANVARAVGSTDAVGRPASVTVTPVSATRDLADADTQIDAAGGGSSSDERPGAAEPKREVAESAVADGKAGKNGKASQDGKVGSLHDFRYGEKAIANGQTGNEEGDASLADVGDEDPSEPKTLSDRELFEMLTTRLLRPGDEAGEAEQSRREIMARHLMVLAGKPDAAVSEIDGLSDEEQEYVRHQLLALWTIIDPGGHPVTGRRFSTALPQLREATKYLAASTDTLEVRSLAFCTEIEAYGQIKEFPRSRFKPGQQVILYCEIENFTSQRSGEGFETHLEGSYSVYDEDDQKVFSQVLPADKQVSRNYLRDYFIAYQMYLPKQLTDGRYRLELTMEDVEGKKYGQASLPFEIRE